MMTQLDLRDSSHPKDPITSHSRWPAVPAMEAANKRKAETTGAETHSKAAKPAEASAKTDEEFRNYDTSDRQSTVEQHYRLMRQNQTYDFAKRMQKKYNSFDHAEMEIYQAFESLGTYVDRSAAAPPTPDPLSLFCRFGQRRRVVTPRRHAAGLRAAPTRTPSSRTSSTGDTLCALYTPCGLSSDKMALITSRSPNIEHSFQTAEGIRAAGHEEWFQLIGLVRSHPTAVCRRNWSRASVLQSAAARCVRLSLHLSISRSIAHPLPPLPALSRAPAQVHDIGKLQFLWGSREDGQEGTADGHQWALGGDTWGAARPPQQTPPQRPAPRSSTMSSTHMQGSSTCRRAVCGECVHAGVQPRVQPRVQTRVQPRVGCGRSGGLRGPGELRLPGVQRTQPGECLLFV